MFTLRDYQKECLEAIEKAKYRSKLVVLPTGSGKTIIFLSHILKKKEKTLILAHTTDLINQTYGKLKQLDPKAKAVIMGWRSKIDEADIVIGTIQSCCQKKSLEKLETKNFDTIIIDEAHHALSPTYQKVIKTLNKKNQKNIIGFTATPVRGDKQNLSKVFKEEIFKKDIFDMMEIGILADIYGYRIKTGINLKGVRTKYGDFALNELAPAINTKERNLLTVKSYKEICKGKKTLVFCADIKHAEEMAEIFRTEKIKCKAIHGKLSKEQRIKTLQDFKYGKIDVLTNCQLLTEGFDEPSIEALIMARPTKSLPLYIQMIGRGIRLHPGKDRCTLIELTDNQHDICCLPKLVTADDKTYPEGCSILKFSKEISEEKRKKDIFSESDKTLHIQKYEVIKKKEKFLNIKNISATEGQLNTMRSLGIKWIDPISYEIAALMITNHKHRKEMEKTYG